MKVRLLMFVMLHSSVSRGLAIASLDEAQRLQR